MLFDLRFLPEKEEKKKRKGLEFRRGFGDNAFCECEYCPTPKTNKPENHPEMENENHLNQTFMFLFFESLLFYDGNSINISQASQWDLLLAKTAFQSKRGSCFQGVVYNKKLRDG